MRICLVTREYPSLGAYGGIGTYTQNLARGLAGRGHDVTVIARSEGAVPPHTEDDVRVVPARAPERWRLPAFNRYVGMTSRSLPFIHAAARTFRALAAEKPFDVVEVPEYQGWGLGVAAVARTPVVVRLHTHTALVRRLNGLGLDADARMVGALESLSLRQGDVVLANSRALATEMAKDARFPLDRIGVLPLGVDADRFKGEDAGWLRQALGLAGPVLLYVGRLERRKGVETLIEAFGRVLERHPGANLLLAGFSTDTGPGQASLLAHLRDRAAELGAASQVRFLGHIPYDELPRYYAGCDMFVAPSLYEPFGMIYLEAMAAGKVAVGCDAGGVPEIIRHGETGLLVPPGDAAALASALVEGLDHPERREALGAAARRAVLAQFALPVIAERTEAHYRGAIEAAAIAAGRLKGVSHAASR